MTDAAELQRRLDALRRARSSGVREVEFVTGEHRQRVAYKSDAELAAAIAALENEIASTAGAKQVRNVIVRSSGGW
jgi:hypothetical protein